MIDITQVLINFLDQRLIHKSVVKKKKRRMKEKDVERKS